MKPAFTHRSPSLLRCSRWWTPSGREWLLWASCPRWTPRSGLFSSGRRRPPGPPLPPLDSSAPVWWAPPAWARRSLCRSVWPQPAARLPLLRPRRLRPSTMWRWLPRCRLHSLQEEKTECDRELMRRLIDPIKKVLILFATTMKQLEVKTS